MILPHRNSRSFAVPDSNLILRVSRFEANGIFRVLLGDFLRLCQMIFHWETSSVLFVHSELGNILGKQEGSCFSLICSCMWMTLIAVILMKQRDFAHWLSNTAVYCVKQWISSTPHLLSSLSHFAEGKKNCRLLIIMLKTSLKVTPRHCNWWWFSFFNAKPEFFET